MQSICVVHTIARYVCVNASAKNTQQEPEVREEKKNAFPYLLLRVNKMRRGKKKVPFKGNLATSKILFNCFIALQGGIFSLVRPTALRTMALLCILFIFYVHNEQSAICIYSQFQSRLPTFICCSLYSSSSSTSFWFLCHFKNTGFAVSLYQSHRLNLTLTIFGSYTRSAFYFMSFTYICDVE